MAAQPTTALAKFSMIALDFSFIYFQGLRGIIIMVAVFPFEVWRCYQITEMACIKNYILQSKPSSINYSTQNKQANFLLQIGLALFTEPKCRANLALDFGLQEEVLLLHVLHINTIDWWCLVITQWWLIIYKVVYISANLAIFSLCRLQRLLSTQQVFNFPKWTTAWTRALSLSAGITLLDNFIFS